MSFSVLIVRGKLETKDLLSALFLFEVSYFAFAILVVAYFGNQNVTRATRSLGHITLRYAYTGMRCVPAHTKYVTSIILKTK
jgi:hypothetical protein